MSKRIAALATSALLICCTFLAPSVAESRSLNLTRALTATGMDDDAAGEARLSVRTRRGALEATLEVKARRLDDRATYDVSLDGIAIGSFTTTSRGRGELRFRTRPRRGDHLLGTDPRGRHMTLSERGSVVLGTTIPDDSVDHRDVRCCLADDSGPECEDRTATECEAEGGVNLGVGTCLPDPCPVVDPPPTETDVRCCLPDDGGAECEDRTMAECAVLNGINLGVGVCQPGDCDGTPLPPDLEDIRCCLPDDGGSECEDRTAAECAAGGGTNLGHGSCDPNPCRDMSPSPGTSPSPATSPSPDTSVSPGTSPSPATSPSPDTSVSPGTSPSPATSPSPDTSVSPGTSPSPATSPSPDTSVSPGTSPSPATSPSPVVSPGLTPTLRVSCERRASRSKISVDGNDLAAGNYSARVTSGANDAATLSQTTAGGEVEFDFDSDGGDIAEGATPITATFIQGSPPAVIAVLLDTQGRIIVQATARCEQR